MRKVYLNKEVVKMTIKEARKIAYEYVMAQDVHSELIEAIYVLLNGE